MTKPKQVILVIEDSPEVNRALQDMFGEVAELIFAADQTSAWVAYCKERERLDIILVDGNVPIFAVSIRPDFTGDLIKRIREDGYAGLILGMPTNEYAIPEMMKAGANEAVEKPEVRRVLREKLGVV